MSWLELKVKPPIIACIAILMMLLLDGLRSDVHLGLGTFGVGLALLLVILGVGLSLIGIQQFLKSETTVHPDLQHATNTLVTSGVYQISRNPMYLGLLLILIAFAIWLNSWLAIGVCVLFVLYLNQFQIKPEERFLQAKFAQQYEDYCKTVRRWL